MAWLRSAIARLVELHDTRAALDIAQGTADVFARGAVAELGEQGMTSVLVEGGGEVHASFLQYRYAEEVIIYVAPKVVGGPAPSWVGGKGIATLQAAYGFRFVGAPDVVGTDLRLRAVRSD